MTVPRDERLDGFDMSLPGTGTFTRVTQQEMIRSQLPATKGDVERLEGKVDALLEMLRSARRWNEAAIEAASRVGTVLPRSE